MRPFSLVCFVLSAAFAGACTVGDTTPGIPGDDEPSGGADAGDDPGPGPDAGPQVACEEPAATLPNGNHNAGLACRGCHDGNTVGAPTWTVAGTLYTDSNGTAPVAGATLIVRDNTGAELKLITASNGNFYTTQAVTFPVTVSASKCPDTRAMTGKPTTGDCNACHTAAAAQGRIHLP